VGAKRAWLAPELLDLCKAYFKKPVPADDVPEIDGDPFTDSQEYPKLFRVGPVALSVPLSATQRSGAGTRTRRHNFTDSR
jgi:hypothetical protein